MPSQAPSSTQNKKQPMTSPTSDKCHHTATDHNMPPQPLYTDPSTSARDSSTSDHLYLAQLSACRCQPAPSMRLLLFWPTMRWKTGSLAWCTGHLDPVSNNACCLGCELLSKLHPALLSSSCPLWRHADRFGSLFWVGLAPQSSSVPP